jgi:hypothetical protein
MISILPLASRAGSFLMEIVGTLDPIFLNAKLKSAFTVSIFSAPLLQPFAH